jgi:hypothetical protein
MDMTQDLKRVPKRRRVIEDGEDELGMTDHQESTSLGRPNLLPPVTSPIQTSGYYDRSSTATVAWGYPAAISSNSTNRQASSYNGLIGQTPATDGIAPSNLYSTGIPSQWSSLGGSIIHSTNTCVSNYQTSPIPHESSQPLFPIATSFYGQFSTSDTRQSHLASTFQPLPDSFAKDPLPECRPCNSPSYQNPQIYSKSPSAQLASDQRTDEIVCFGMVSSTDHLTLRSFTNSPGPVYLC